MGAKGIDGFVQRWSSPSQLERVTNWAARGCTMAEMAGNMGVNPNTLYEWQRRHPELREAIEAGRMLGVQAVENSLFRQAVGEVYEEQTVTEKDVLSDGTERVHVRKVRTRKAPSTAATIFYLKNRAGYRDNPPEAARPDEAPVDPLSQALIERAGRLDRGA